jgi:hypothetical protein
MSSGTDTVQADARVDLQRASISPVKNGTTNSSTAR